MNSRNPKNAHPERKPTGPRRRAWWALGALVALALAAIAVWSASSRDSVRQVAAPVTRAAAGTPALRVDRTSIDLGDVKLGTFVEAAFVLTNAGGQQLRLAQPPYIEVVEGC